MWLNSVECNVPILRLVMKKDGIVIAEKSVLSTIEETKLAIFAILMRRWGLKWEEDES